MYPEAHETQGDPVEIDDEILLIVRGRAHMPGRVVRTFDNGFAVRFDWSIEVEHDRFMTFEDK